jgi:hypothetical protein
MDTAVRKRRLEQHEVERPSAFRKLTGEPPAQKGVEPEAARPQVSLLASAAELVAVLEAFDVARDHNGGRKNEAPDSGRQIVADVLEQPRTRGPEPAAAGRETSVPVAGLTGTAGLLRGNAAAHSARPQTSANERVAQASEVGQHPRTSPDVAPFLAWREFFAQFRTPNARYLVITAQDQASLYDFFGRAFAGMETVEVTMDRRFGERRPASDPVAVEPSRPDRRSRPEIDAELRASGFAVVRSLSRPDVGRTSSSRGEQGHPPTLGRAPAAVEAPRRSPFSRATSA